MPDSIADSPQKQLSAKIQSVTKVGDEDFQDDMWKAVSTALPNSATEKLSEDSSLSDSPLSDAPFMMSEARSFYRNRRPPFVVSRCRENSAGATKAVIVAEDGRFPANQKRIELIAGIWDKKYAYWTMDVGGKELIVKAFSGAPGGGAAWRPWLGPELEFQDPVAFSILASRRKKPSHERIKRDLSCSEKDDEDPTRRSSRTTARTAKAEAAERITNSFVSPVLGRREEIAVEMYATDEGIHNDSDVEPKESHLVPLNFLPTPNVDLEIRRSSHNIATHRTVKKRFSQKWNGTSPLPTPIKRQIETPSSLELTYTMLPKAKKARRDRRSKVADEKPVFANSAITPNPSSQHLPSPNSSILSSHQLMNTILHVSLPPRTDYVPIRLRSCITIDTFFGSIVNAFDLQGNENNLDAARVTFEWLPKNDKNRSWLVKRNVDDSFEMLLECVSMANVWVDEGKAVVRVEILMKDAR